MRWTARQERFCLLVVAGEPNYAAYEQAGYNVKSKVVATANACKLLQSPSIQNRIAELMETRRQASDITLDSLTKDLIEIRREARLAGSYGPAVQATLLLAKMHGLVVERSEVSVMHRPAPLPTKVLELSEDEWLRQFGVEGKHRLLKAVKDKS